MATSELVFRVKSFLFRRGMRVFRARPSSDPYISGDSFRALADVVYEVGNKCGAGDIREKSIVFVESGLLKEFFKTIHPVVTVPYILLSHNGDITIDESFLPYIDEKIIHWYAQNARVKHSKITPIPIGLENFHYYWNGIPALFDYYRKNNTTKREAKILFGFSASTNPRERESALQALHSCSIAVEIQGWPIPSSYLQTLQRFMFVASPEGNGLDCHRTWEAMYMGVVPIVKRSVAMEYFVEQGIPLWIIDDWNELQDVGEEILRKKYNELSNKFNSPALLVDFWDGMIQKTGNCVLENNKEVLL